MRRSRGTNGSHRIEENNHRSSGRFGSPAPAQERPLGHRPEPDIRHNGLETRRCTRRLRSGNYTRFGGHHVRQNKTPQNDCRSDEVVKEVEVRATEKRSPYHIGQDRGLKHVGIVSRPLEARVAHNLGFQPFQRHEAITEKHQVQAEADEALLADRDEPAGAGALPVAAELEHPATVSRVLVARAAVSARTVIAILFLGSLSRAHRHRAARDQALAKPCRPARSGTCGGSPAPRW